MGNQKEVDMEKKRLIIAVGAMVFVVGILSITYFFATRTTPNNQTGGGGQAQVGSLILSGFEIPSNDSSHIPLSEFLTIDQESIIRSSLEVLLYKKQPQQEYTGTIVPGTVDVDYRTNDIHFNIKIKNPSITYSVTFNSVSDNITVLDSKGNILSQKVNGDNHLRN